MKRIEIGIVNAKKLLSRIVGKKDVRLEEYVRSVPYVVEVTSIQDALLKMQQAKVHMTVVIDELDSGVFEYLLGEIQRILAEKGKGQLVFTSHNLRPLETLDKGFIAFTTTNPQNRYIRMINVKTTHNLRDFYYRDIVLGEQNEPVYEMTNNSEIAMAFREAGNPDAS